MLEINNLCLKCVTLTNPCVYLYDSLNDWRTGTINYYETIRLIDILTCIFIFINFYYSIKWSWVGESSFLYLNDMLTSDFPRLTDGLMINFHCLSFFGQSYLKAWWPAAQSAMKSGYWDTGDWLSRLTWLTWFPDETIMSRHAPQPTPWLGIPKAVHKVTIK